MKKLITLFALLASFAGISHAANGFNCRELLEIASENIVLLQAQGIMASRNAKPLYNQLEVIKQKIESGQLHGDSLKLELAKADKLVAQLAEGAQSNFVSIKKSLSLIPGSLSAKCGNVASLKKPIAKLNRRVQRKILDIDDKEQILKSWQGIVLLLKNFDTLNYRNDL